MTTDLIIPAAFSVETATKEERREVINRYNGDYGASVSVQMNRKTVSLDIYDITHDKIRIMDENAEKSISAMTAHISACGW